MLKNSLKIYRFVNGDYYRLIDGIRIHKLEKQIGHIGLLDNNQPDLEDLPEFRFDPDDCLDFSTLVYGQSYTVPYRSKIGDLAKGMAGANEIFPDIYEQKKTIKLVEQLRDNQDVATIKFATYLNDFLNENGEKLSVSLAIINLFYNR